jgi:hypothetical protein
MAEIAKAPTPKVNDAVPAPHDRVAVLSVRADGTHDQLNPELLDPEGVKDYTKRQFSEQAVGEADRANAPIAGPTTIIGTPEGEPDKIVPATEVKQDPSIESAQAEHERVQKAAEKAAEAVVTSLSKGA